MKPILNLASLEGLAKSRLEKMTFDFVAGGAEDEITLAENVRAWERIPLYPRVLRGAKDHPLETSVLGQKIAFPILVAPMGFQCLANPEGEAAGARGAAEAGTIFALSTASTRSIEEVARASDGPKWFQLYVYRDRSITRSLIDRAVRSGYRALCFTVDNPIEGRRERDKVNGFKLPKGITLANFRDDPALRSVGAAENESALTEYIEKQWDHALSWSDVDWVASQSRLPLIVKGILTARDARKAVDHGAKAVVVSNHGGRQLDGVPATADVLAEVVDAVGSRCEVLVDGGIRRGTHVLRALAIGARAVLIGRPVYWGLAIGGEKGVAAVLRHLADELSVAMELSGCPTLSDITRDLIRKDSPG